MRLLEPFRSSENGIIVQSKGFCHVFHQWRSSGGWNFGNLINRYVANGASFSGVFSSIGDVRGGGGASFHIDYGQQKVARDKIDSDSTNDALN